MPLALQIFSPNGQSAERDSIKFIGKRGLSYIGAKNAESAYTLGDQNLDHGHFLETLLLVAKFDLF
ncbi:Uncharacterized protein FWK35_00029572, partial [Aphis craccivora]